MGNAVYAGTEDTERMDAKRGVAGWLRASRDHLNTLLEWSVLLGLVPLLFLEWNGGVSGRVVSLFFGLLFGTAGLLELTDERKQDDHARWHGLMFLLFGFVWLVDSLPLPRALAHAQLAGSLLFALGALLALVADRRGARWPPSLR